MSEIDQFRLVLAVARSGSISEVAQLTGLSQPTVTRAVRATERLVGFPLFHRTPDGTRPTGDAAKAFRRIESILENYDALASLDDSPVTVLRFAYREGELPTILDSAMAHWNREKMLPAKLIECVDPVAELQAGGAEFAVAPYSGTPFPDGFDHRPLRIIRTARLDLVYAAAPTGPIDEFLQALALA
ncbi:LysR family transcriptional regulator [Tsukamurella hominis]|uniref:LysR family transcriptional regulator n=1 Tax=Tsukamurella hominis TaxID=1970232 RepID=UPI0039E8E838